MSTASITFSFKPAVQNALRVFVLNRPLPSPTRELSVGGPRQEQAVEPHQRLRLSCCPEAIWPVGGSHLVPLPFSLGGLGRFDLDGLFVAMTLSLGVVVTARGDWSTAEPLFMAWNLPILLNRAIRYEPGIVKK